MIERIAADAGKAMRDPDMVKRLLADGSESMVGTPQQFGALIQSETKLWSDVIKKAGIQGEGG